VKEIENLKDQIEELGVAYNNAQKEISMLKKYREQNKRYREVIDKVKDLLKTANVAYTSNIDHTVNYKIHEASEVIETLEGKERGRLSLGIGMCLKIVCMIGELSKKN